MPDATDDARKKPTAVNGQADKAQHSDIVELARKWCADRDVPPEKMEEAMRGLRKRVLGGSPR